jgi:16S rRNA (adenine1518-N6/adenine1519-N6)-dimethyltransferase
MGVYPRLVKSNAPDAKKRFGQHFLRDTGVIDRIVRWIRPAPDDVFLEIGAGGGSLSCQLAPKVCRFLAVEIDTDCIPKLEEVLQPFQGSIVIQGDFLHMDISALASQCLGPGQHLRVAGNLPYNIATVIIEKLLHSKIPILDMFFMLQLEVAQRITAHPGSRQYGYLSVHCQHHSDVQMGFKVSAGCFAPRPKVTSSMISLRPKPDELAPDFEADFEAICKAAFSHRRKTLSNALAKQAAFGSIANALLDRAGINGSRRAEELSVGEYEHLASIYRNEFNQKEREAGIREPE